jgi:hypothetical protein
MLEDLFETILEGAGSGQPPQRKQSSGDPLADLLGGILGGASGGQRGGAGMGDLLEGILGGGGPQGAGDMGDLLEGILGGGGGPQGAGGMGDLLEGILGGGAQQQPRRSAAPPADGIAGILGGILGGTDMGSNSFLAPIIEGLAEKLGLPPAVAQMVISFVLSKLLAGAGSRGQAPVPGARPRTQPRQVTPQGFDLDHLLGQMGSEGGLDSNYLMSTGMHTELAEQTGLDPETAARSMEEALNMMLGGQRAARTPPPVNQPKPGSLDNLLDTW